MSHDAVSIVGVVEGPREVDPAEEADHPRSTLANACVLGERLGDLAVLEQRLGSWDLVVGPDFHRLRSLNPFGHDIITERISLAELSQLLKTLVYLAYNHIDMTLNAFIPHPSQLQVCGEKHSSTEQRFAHNQLARHEVSGKQPALVKLCFEANILHCHERGQRALPVESALLGSLRYAVILPALSANLRADDT